MELHGILKLNQIILLAGDQLMFAISAPMDWIQYYLTTGKLVKEGIVAHTLSIQIL